MRADIDAILEANSGVVDRRSLLRHVTRGSLDHEVHAGRLVAPFGRAYCRPWNADQPDVRERAALLSVGPPAALSHLTALRRTGVLDLPADADVHVTVPRRRNPRPQAGLHVHRAAVLPRLSRAGEPCTTFLADALVASWPLLPATQRRGPAITAVRNGLVAPDAITRALDRHPRVGDKAALRELIGLLAAGCESELEIWGLLRVFDHPGLRHGVRQRWVHAGGRAFRLDLAFEAERVAVELDGDRWHSTREQRERDRRRDAALATAGWVTLRFSFRRLHDDVAGCRADLLATLATRRRGVVGRV